MWKADKKVGKQVCRLVGSRMMGIEGREWVTKEKTKQRKGKQKKIEGRKKKEIKEKKKNK
jgi:hypothetical protein